MWLKVRYITLLAFVGLNVLCRDVYEKANHDGFGSEYDGFVCVGVESGWGGICGCSEPKRIEGGFGGGAG
jgi:hypothetical protein